MTKAYFPLSAPENLSRFQLGELLGEGADLQVFAATDGATGERVAVKRPHPSLVSRNIHRDAERRALLQARIRAQLKDVSGLARFFMLTESDSFRWYFGDDLGYPYSVQVEERANGIPLVGSVSDMVRGRPIALPLNLFVLHPAKSYLSHGYDNPALTVLDIIKQLHEEGYLAQDLSPQNVFYSPGSGACKIIDLGALRKPNRATRRQPAFDMNDILFDIFRLYTTPDKPLTDTYRFAQVRKFRLSGALERKAEALSKEFAATDEGRAETSLKILSTIGERGYVSTARFRTDFKDYLAAAQSARGGSDTEEAWRQAAQELRSSYWNKYLFDARDELPEIA